MNAPIFGHGQLRLYLLSLLDEGPLSGYDVIRTLEQRFDGLYSPSAGTIYPRLAKLEEEGLVTRTDEGRRSIYSITDAGREELSRRSEEVEGLGDHVEDSSARLAEELRRKVTDGATALWAELDDAARQARARAEEQDRSKAGEMSDSGSDSGFGSDSASGSHDDMPSWMRGNRGPFGGIPVETFENLARDFSAAGKFRSEYGSDFAKFAQWAASGFGKGSTGASTTGGGVPWWLRRAEEPARQPEDPPSSSPADEDEVIAEIIETETFTESTASSETGEKTGGLDEAQVRRVIDILRTAADDLEKTLRG